jgi:hypothetical protein
MMASVQPSGFNSGADVMFVKSTNGGQSFSAPRRVNDDPVNHNKYHWFGTLAVAPNGRIDSIWFDSRNAANNTDSQLFYSYSTDGGDTWAASVAASIAFNPFLGYPNQNKLGDYMTIISDNTGADVAYAATFNLEQDVYYVRLAPGIAPVTPTPSPTPTATATATSTATVPPSPTPTATATATSTATVTATATGSAPPPTPSGTPSSSPTPVSTPTPTPSSSPAAQPLNLSTRLLVLTDANVGIGGFIITGTEPKQVVLRGIGPSLSNFGVPNPLPDPVLELHGPSGFQTITNDNWQTPPVGGCDLTALGLAPPNNLEAAICATLEPGQYTAILRGNNNGTGVGLVEVYDVGQAAMSKLANISTRGFVSTGSDIVIAGFILGGNAGVDNVIVRGLGPSLTAFGIPNVLADPQLELRDSSGTLIRANNDWMDDPTQKALIMAAGLAPTNNLESAIAETLAPGQYTVSLSGMSNGTGTGLVEVYDRGSQ